MRIIFNGKILDNQLLQQVDHVLSDTEGKTDVVALLGSDDDQDVIAAPSTDEQIILETFDTEQAAIDYINGLGDKLVAQLGADEVIDAR